MENDAIVVTFNENGTFSIFDKATRKRSADIHLFEDISDGGDGWEFKPIENDKAIRFDNAKATISVFEANNSFTTFKIDLPLKLPAAADFDKMKRSDDMVDYLITSYVSLYSGPSRMVQIRTEFINTAKDHRLRVLFPAHIQASKSVVGGMFALTERPIDPPDSKKWRFKPEMHFPHQYFFHVYDHQKCEGLAVITKGLFEYEVYKEKEKELQIPALTLIRANGKWGRHLGMGRGIDIPNAQMHGMKVVSEYGVVLLANEQPDFEYGLYQMALNYNLPLRAEENFDAFRLNVPISARNVPATFGLINIEGQGILYSNCYKPKDKKGIAIRLYNITGVEQPTTLTIGCAFQKASFMNLLDESVEKEEKIDLESNAGENITKMKFIALPFKIYTIFFE